MKKIVITLIAIITVSLSAEAQKQSRTTKVRFQVDGVCTMCKERIEKAVILIRGVKFANWNVETKELYCVYNNKKTTELKIKQAIAAVGHDTEEVKAPDEIYSKLDACCLYRDDTIKTH